MTAKRAGLPFSEETITEIILLDLATQNPLEVIVQPINKRQEALTGADWEWCIFNKNETRFMRMLVQAKVLDNLDDEYAHIDRKIGNTGIRQIDKLLDTARQRHVPALYVFYNHVANVSRVPVAACQCFSCLECWGCSVTLAVVVQSMLPDKSFDTLKRVSVPWACLLCPKRSVAGETVETPYRVENAIQRLLQMVTTVSPTESFDPHRVSLDDLVRSEPPPYFSELRQLQRIDQPHARDVILERLATQNPGVDGFVLVTDRKEGAAADGIFPQEGVQ